MTLVIQLLFLLLPRFIFSKTSPWQYSIDPDFTDIITESRQPSFGKEVVVPINVEESSDAAAVTFFQTIDNLLRSRLSSHHSANYVYHAHHSGANTEYYTQTTGQDKKGWIGLVSGTSVSLQWEGDLEACNAIKDTSGHSNQECTEKNLKNCD